ncbi:hypothetical protein BH24ACT20_BH24ACT20_16900 [soil metagenome]|jgi:hypothetical protein
MNAAVAATFFVLSIVAVVKVTALILFMLGVPFLFYGISSVLESGSMKRTVSKRRAQSSRKDAILTLLSFVSASTPILVTVVKATFGL